jgi:hypothetical protein
VMTKCQGPSWIRSNSLESGLVKRPKRDTRVLSPAGMIRGKAPLRLVAKNSRPLVPLAQHLEGRTRLHLASGIGGVRVAKWLSRGFIRRFERAAPARKFSNFRENIQSQTQSSEHSPNIRSLNNWRHTHTT